MSRRGVLLLVLAALVFPLLLQGSRGLLDPDEGRYAEVAREMLAGGDWLVPRLAGQPHFDKPPLTYWLTAAGLAVLGRNAWGARTALGLAAGLTALLAGLIARRLGGRRAFAPAVLIELLAFGPFLGGSILTTDAFLTLFETLAVLGFVEAWAGGPHHRRWAAVMGLGFGLAFLTKGPPGLLPLAAIGAFVAWRGRRSLSARRRLWSPWGLAAGIVVGLGWYAIVVATRPGLAGWLVSEEVVARVVSTHHHRNNPAAMYVVALLAGFLPWTVALPSLAGGWRASLARVGRRLRRPGDDRVRFLLLWLLVPLAVFVAARSRLPLYVLPLFVPLAVGGSLLLRGLAGEAEAGHWAAGDSAGASAGAAATSPASGATAVPRSTPGLVRVVVAWAVALLLLKAAAAWWIPWQADMRHLDRELRALARDGRAIVIGDEHLHGLRFYRDGELATWRRGPGSPPIGLAAGLRAEARIETVDRLPRIFVGRRHADWMRAALTLHGSHAAAVVRGRDVFLLEPRQALLAVEPRGASSHWAARPGRGRAPAEATVLLSGPSWPDRAMSESR